MVVNKLWEYINNQLENNRLAHVFLLETNNIELCYKDVKDAIKNLNCPHTFASDCKEDCNLCYLIDNDSLPSMVTISPDGTFIKKDQVLELKEKLAFKPVYSRYNTYIILEADKLNPQAANTILKFLEEPEEHVLGFLITTNKENIMATIKSRCQTFSLMYEETTSNDSTIEELTTTYLKDVINQKGLEVNRLGLDRESTLTLFKYMLMLVRDDIINNDFLEIEESNKVKLMELIENLLQKIKYNVNLDMLLDSFYIEVGRIING